jgi:hypothetical protein
MPRMLLLTLLVACTRADEQRPVTPPKPPMLAAPALAPAPPPPPVTTTPPVTTPRPTHMVPRKQLDTSDTPAALLPKHGIVVHSWGLGGDGVTIVDQDAKTVRTVSNLIGESKHDKTSPLDAKKLLVVTLLASLAKTEDPVGPMPSATDIREDLFVLDGDEAFYLSGYPITNFGGGDTGRPEASDLMEAMYRLVP